MRLQLSNFFIHTILLEVVSPDAQAADFLRANDKFNVVFTVVLTIFAVIMCFLIWLERSLISIEKNQKKNISNKS